MTTIENIADQLDATDKETQNLVKGRAPLQNRVSDGLSLSRPHVDSIKILLRQ